MDGESGSLKAFSANVYSQHGEDGIVREVLRRIGERASLDRWCVEFGAWDGVYLSNTCRLIREENYHAVLIEGDDERFQQLCENLPGPEVHKIRRFVSFSGDSTLDAILATTPIPPDFDFLSIDIDGCDYYVLESLKRFRPKVLCVEYNPSVPNDVEFVQVCDFGVKQGAGALSLVRLASEKGYSLVAVTESNLLFVRADLVESVCGAKRPTLNDLRDDTKSRVYLFCGYDGTILSNASSLRLPWHGIDVPTQRMQVLPKVLRQYAADYGSGRRKIFRLWSAFAKLTGGMRKSDAA